LLAVVGGKLPPKGSVVGASERAVCDECQRKKNEKKVSKFYRPWQKIQDFDTCLMEQGILCAGSATRGGCGVRCPNTGQGCRGCYGPMPNVKDQGAKLLSAVSSVIDSKDPKEIERILAGIPDFVSMAYRFGLPASMLQRSFQQ
jgi:F420-non-reducing hydrogenase small subunit